MTLDLSLDDFEGQFRHVFRFERTGVDFALRFPQPIDEEELPIQEVGPKAIRAVLNKCLRGEITAEALQGWANFLILFPAYDFDGTVSSILHLVATPEIHEELNDSTIRYYLSCLDSGKDPLSG